MSAATMNGGGPSKPFSISFGSKSKPLPSKVAPKKRTYATLTEDDSDEDQDAPSGKAQLVHAFDQAAGGAVGDKVKEERGPLVITAQKNLDWREEARRKRGGANLLPEEEQARRAGTSQKEESDHNLVAPVYGLLITDKSQANGDVQMTEAASVEEKPKTADEEAIEALLGEKKSSLVIEQAEYGDTRFESRTNDSNAFRADIASRPESASLADYEAVPIEDFGLALLRGQGYKPGDPIGRRKTANPVVTKIPQKRANLLGIGAKEVPEGLEELGAWGKGSKKGNKIDRSYNPLVMRNRATGEVLTEAELKAKKEQQSVVMEEPSEKTSRRHRDRDEDRYESSRHSSSRRDRSRSRDRKERRDRGDDRRQRDKDRERHRSRERDRDRESRKDSERRDERKGHRYDERDRRDRKDRYEDDRRSSKDYSRHDAHRDDYEDRKHRDRRRD